MKESDLQNKYVLYNAYTNHDEAAGAIELRQVIFVNQRTYGRYATTRQYCRVLRTWKSNENTNKCLDAGLTISGTNAEVMSSQGIKGPCSGIDSGDQLRMRYERICEESGLLVNWHPNQKKESKWFRVSY